MHEFGYGSVVNKRLRHIVPGFTPMNERVATICIMVKFYNISDICAHAPTEEKDDVVKDTFFCKLENVINAYPMISVRRSIGKVSLAPTPLV